MGNFSKKRALDDDSGGPQAEASSKPVSKKSKPSQDLESGQDGDGNPYWEIAPKRRVGISEFKRTTFINIREYYEANGEMKPGKKGISLSLDQYQALLKVIPAINAQLRKAGVPLEDAGSTDLPQEAEASESKAQTKTQRARKANIEATSDEESS